MCLKKAAGIKNGIQVRLIKGIPVGSGLGGGSSDAAAVLTAVNELFDVHFSPLELHELALQIGSDVPFFLEKTAGIVTGRGDVFEPLKARSGCFGIIIWPDVMSSTNEAYRRFDQAAEIGDNRNKPWGTIRLQKQYYAPISTWQFVNDFQAVLGKHYPRIGQACVDLHEQGAVFVRMTGAGSAVFGLFEQETEIASAFRLLQKKWHWCKPFILLA